jgi:hypothetical protein
VVASDAVFEAMDAPGILRDVAPDRANNLTGWIGRVVEAIATDGLRHPIINHPRLHNDLVVVVVDVDDLAHHRSRDQHAFLDRQCPAGESGARSTGDKGYVMVVANFDDSGDFLGGARQDNDRGTFAVAGQTVTFIDEQFLFAAHHGTFADDRHKGFDQRPPIAGGWGLNCCDGHHNTAPENDSAETCLQL